MTKQHRWIIAGAMATLGFAGLVASGSSVAAADVVTIGFTESETGALNVDSIGQFNGFRLSREASPIRSTWPFMMTSQSQTGSNSFTAG